MLIGRALGVEEQQDSGRADGQVECDAPTIGLSDKRRIKPTPRLEHHGSTEVRWQTRAGRLQVLEVQPPTGDTDLVKSYSGPKVQPDVVARAVVKALRSGKSELAVGQAKALSILARVAPATSYRLMNTTVEKTLPFPSAPASTEPAQHRP